MKDLFDNLNAVGKPVWIGLMVAGFIWFWPIGLAVLAYLVWSGKLGSRGFSAGLPWTLGFWSSGNSAFDKHIEEARKQLEQERADFTTFVKAKLDEKDQAEFAEFVNKRKAA